MTTSALRDAPTLDVSFSSPEFARDGYAVYEEIRQTGPVVYAPGPLDGGDLAPGDGYLCTGFRTCSRILGNVKRYRQPPEFFTNKFGDLVFEGIDGPRHNEVRAPWMIDFQRETLREKQLEMVDQVVEECITPVIDRIRSGDVVDLVSELHERIPLYAVLNMLDLPKEDHDELRGYALGMTGVELGGATAAMNQYVAGVAAERSGTGGTDLISVMLESDVAATMTRSEIVANSSQLVFAGAGTTTTLMSSCIVLLAMHPDQRRAVDADRSLVPRAIEEVLRYRGVTQLTAPRIVVDGDAEVDGVRVPEGAQIIAMVGAANRDPDRWERPNELDVLREPKQHLGFGFGMHSCLGMNLARLEIEVYLNRMLDLLPEWQVTNEIDLSNPFGTIPEIMVAAP
jgi:cytochrome P450